MFALRRETVPVPTDQDAARTAWTMGGRKPVVSREKLERVRTMVAKGLTVREAATRLKIGKTALYEAFRACTDPAAGAQAGTHR